jgi:hypothetical protein
MKIMSVAAMAVLVGGSIWAGAIPGQNTRKVTACVGGVKHFDQLPIYRARVIVAEMYSEIGVTIDWRSQGRSCPAQGAVMIELTDGTPATLAPGALAYALPYDRVHIRVFLDRVTEAVGPEKLPHLLAHVLAHEIGHVLQGIERHSETGVMMAKWTSEDYKQMVVRPLAFTEEDVILIHNGMEGRAVQLLAMNANKKAPERPSAQSKNPSQKYVGRSHGKSLPD